MVLKSQLKFMELAAFHKAFAAFSYDSISFLFLNIRRALYWRALQLFGTQWNHLRLALLGLGIHVARSKTRFAITHSYGRTGNNIQQILIAIAHAEAFRGVLDVEIDNLVDGRLGDLIYSFSLDFSPRRPERSVFRSMFFHYSEHTFFKKDLSRLPFKRGVLPRRECLLSTSYIERNLWRIAQSYLLSNLILSDAEVQIDDRLVLHLRSGDVASLAHSHYITNPLCFYRRLATMYDDVVIVMEPGQEHVLFRSIVGLFKRVDVVSGSVQEDFHRLCKARYLATSGVGTFPIAASLLSRSLQTLHCTDLFQEEHLNPRMLMGESVKGITIDLMRMPGFQRLWIDAIDRRELLLDYETPVLVAKQRISTPIIRTRGRSQVGTSAKDR